jgi:hypothetical protein
LICHVCQATGWRWDYVEDHLTMPRLRALKRYWAQSPPPHLLLALIARALLGPDRSAPPAAVDPWQELASLAADPAAGLAVRGKPPR